MNSDDISKRILNEEDFIRSTKFNNSLFKLRVKWPDGAEDDLIAKVLLMTEEEVEKIYQEALAMIREGMLDE